VLKKSTSGLHGEKAMNSEENQKFDIRDFSESLTKAKKGFHECPNCNKPRLTIQSNSGKYNCWNCNDTKAIARILTEPQREEKRRERERERSAIAPAKTQQERIDEWLIGSAVNEALISKNLRQIEDPQLIARLLDWRSYSSSPGWYVCSCDPLTGNRTNKGQFKPDVAISFQNSPDKTQKYISFPKGAKGGDSSAAVYLALAMSDWELVSETVGVPILDSDVDESRDDLGFWQWVLNHPEIQITITEGIKKEASLLSLGRVAISLTGVWNGQVGKGRKLHKDLAPFIVCGRPVYLAFDSDLLVKENVSDALRQLGRLCRQEKAEVFILGWEPERGKGIDDFIVSQGKLELENLYRDGITPYSEWLIKAQQVKNGSRAMGSSEGNNRNRIDEGDRGANEGNDGNQINEGDRGSNESNVNLPPENHPEAFYWGACKGLELDFENCVTAQTFDGWVYRREFGARDGDWRVADSAFYQWNEELGYWQHNADNKINAQIADAGEKAFKLKYSKEFGWQVLKPYELNSHKESAFKYCRSRLERSEAAIANTHLRAFKNCVVDMRTGERMPHDKAYYLTNIIPYDYEPGKECPEVFRQFVVDSFGEDMLPIIRAFTSMFLDPTAPYGRFPHLIGKSGGGKGTLGRFWNSLFGEDGASSGEFANLATAEGRHQYLTGKSIFAIPDAGGYVSGLRAFYELVDGGGLSGRALFNPVGYFKNWCIRFWIASVDHLQIENAGDGWARRAWPIPVRSRTVKPDPDLKLKLEAVKADVISWALAMAREERDRILLSPPENERVINLTLDAALYGDSTKSFVDLCLRPTAERSFVPNHKIHSWYVAYCKEHGYTPLGMTKLMSHLKTVRPENFVDRGWSPMINGKRSRVPAHWEFLEPLEGAFVKLDAEVQSQGFSPPTPLGNPTWICIKAACEEGGLMEFEDFWNPPQPPNNVCDNNGDNGKPPQHPPDSPIPPESGSGGSTGSIFPESLKQRNSGGVQGGSTVQGIGSDNGKNLVSVLELAETEISLNSISEGVQEGSKLDSRKTDQIDLLCDEVSQVTGVTLNEVKNAEVIHIEPEPDKPLTLAMLVGMLKAVTTLGELEAIEEQAKASGLEEEKWKHEVWRQVDEDTRSRLKLLNSRRQPSSPLDLEFCLSVLAQLEEPGHPSITSENEVTILFNEIEVRSGFCQLQLPTDFWNRATQALKIVSDSLARMNAIGKRCSIKQLRGSTLNPFTEWVDAVMVSKPNPPMQMNWIFKLADETCVPVCDEDEWRLLDE